MKKIMMLFVLLLFIFSVNSLTVNIKAADGDNVSIPDSNLKASIVDQLGLPVGSEVTELQMKSLTYLWTNNTDIADLTGLEYAVNLETFTMKTNNVTDFSVISLLASLDNLTIQAYNLNDNNFPNMNNLHIRTMDISDSNLTPAVYNKFIQMTTIETLFIQRNNKITSIAQLKNLPNLKTLFLQFSGVSDFTPINDFHALKSLYAFGQDTGNYDPITTMYKGDFNYNEAAQTLFIPFSIFPNRFTNFDGNQPPFTQSTAPSSTQFFLNDFILPQSRLAIDSNGITILNMSKTEYDTISSLVYSAAYNNPTGSYPTPAWLTNYVTSSARYTQKINLLNVPIPKYEVIYQKNGATSGVVPIDSKLYAENDNVIVRENTSLKKNNHTFIGWNTKSDGSGIMYQANNSFNIKQNIILYATWKPNVIPVSYSIVYNGNGSTNGVVPKDNEKYKKGAITKVLTKGTLEKTNYTFIDWNTKKDGTGKSYKQGATIAINSDVILFAQWKKSDNILPYTGNNQVILVEMLVLFTSVFGLVRIANIIELNKKRG